MGRYNTNQDSMELGFQVPEPGEYIFQIEKAELKTNEDTAKTTFRITSKIVEAIERGDKKGDPKSVDLKITHFVPIETKYGEQMVCQYLTITNLAGAFEKRFPDDTPFTDKTFVDSLILKLPDKIFRGEVDVREDAKGRRNANFQRIQRAGKTKPMSKPKSNESTPTPAQDTDEDW